jgi:hypothetical protein
MPLRVRSTRQTGALPHIPEGLQDALVIESAEEFVRLRTSDDPAEYRRAAHEEASIETWYEVIERFPDMRFWVAQNKTVPLPILEHLRHDQSDTVREMVRRKHSWAQAHPNDSSRPTSDEPSK